MLSWGPKSLAALLVIRHRLRFAGRMLCRGQQVVRMSAFPSQRSLPSFLSAYLHLNTEIGTYSHPSTAYQAEAVM